MWNGRTIWKDVSSSSIENPAKRFSVESEEKARPAYEKALRRFHRLRAFSELAAGEGFEPSHTESESAVLPLHKPAIALWNSYHYTKKLRLVKTFSVFFKISFSRKNQDLSPFRPAAELWYNPLNQGLIEPWQSAVAELFRRSA